MNNSVYEAAFPLHEGRYDKDGPQGEKSDRRVSMAYFLLWVNIVFSFCILSGLIGQTGIRNNLSGSSRDTLEIRYSFAYIRRGLYLCYCQIGLYFAWLGFYNQLLIMPAVFGFLVFLYGALTVMNWDINYAGLVMDKSSLF